MSTDTIAPAVMVESFGELPGNYNQEYMLVLDDAEWGPFDRSDIDRIRHNKKAPIIVRLLDVFVAGSG
jgi:hypothetical protein